MGWDAKEPREHDEQAKFFKICDWRAQGDGRYHAIFSIPNAGRRSEGALFYYLSEGLKPGVPDIFVAVRIEQWGGLFIEFKRRGQALRKNQQEWRERLIQNGYAYLLVFSAEDALRDLEKYFAATLSMVQDQPKDL